MVHSCCPGFLAETLGCGRVVLLRAPFSPWMMPGLVILLIYWFIFFFNSSASWRLISLRKLKETNTQNFHSFFFFFVLTIHQFWNSLSYYFFEYSLSSILSFWHFYPMYVASSDTILLCLNRSLIFSVCLPMLNYEKFPQTYHWVH